MSQQHIASWFRRHWLAILFIAALFYVPVSALLALIHPSLAWGAIYVGVASGAILCLPFIWWAMPGLLMWLGAALFLGGLIERNGAVFSLVGALMAVSGYIWAQKKSD